MSQFPCEDQTTQCLKCGVEVKWKNLLAHVMKKHPIKVHWKSIPILRAQQLEKQKIKKALGSTPTATFVQGGATGLKK